MATDTRDDDDDEYRCLGCGVVLGAPWDEDDLFICDCFHAMHERCAYGRDACPRCHTPMPWWIRDDDWPKPVDEPAAAATASPPDNNQDEGSALASDGVGDRGPGGGKTGEPRPSRCDGDGESPASMSGSGCNRASRLGCCACSSRRVTELESRLEEKSAALNQTTNALESELERTQSRLCRLEEMYGKLEEELNRLRNYDDEKRAREIEDDDDKERKKQRE